MNTLYLGSLQANGFIFIPDNELILCPQVFCFCTNSRWFDATLVCMYNKHDNLYCNLVGGENIFCLQANVFMCIMSEGLWVL